MTQERQPLPLWSDAVPHRRDGDAFTPHLVPFLLTTDRPRGAVLVCPGGGYGGRAPHEGEPVARAFNERGYHAFVVHYRVAPYRHPVPMMDLSRAVRVVRSRAAAWRVDPKQVAVLGFSAGGHLAGSLGVLGHRHPFREHDDLHGISNRPDAMILCYPVVTSGRYGHAGSFDNLLGPGRSEEASRALSLERHVTKQTSPAFLWHTVGDPGVPVENLLLLAGALSRKKVPFELHVYPGSTHGIGLAPNDPHVATWADLCAAWLRELPRV